MKNLINILFIMMCIGIQAQETLPKTSFEIEFDFMELSAVEPVRAHPDIKEFIPIGEREHLGTISFIRSDSGYTVYAKSCPDQEDSFGLTFNVEYPIELNDPDNVWQFDDINREFIIYCDASYRWVYLYAENIKEYIQFKKIRAY